VAFKNEGGNFVFFMQNTLIVKFKKENGMRKEKMRRKVEVFSMCILLVLVCFVPKVSASNDIGIVLLHGSKKATKWIAPLVKQLKKAKIQVVTPEMTWSENRRWDVNSSDTMTEIDNAVASLKNNGATKIFVGGHSIGGSVALAYAINKKDIAGVLLIAPAHTNEMEGFQEQLEANVAYAKQMVNDGKGDEVLSYPGKPCNDVVKANPKVKQMNWSASTSSAIYLSHFAPDAKDTMPENLQKINGNTAVLWIAGKADSWTKTDGEKVFAMAPQNPNNRYIVVKGGHLQTPAKGKKEIVSWVMETGSM
jgi:alpha-beta hydrolase superfamily lysophospholipase